MDLLSLNNTEKWKLRGSTVAEGVRMTKKNL